MSRIDLPTGTGVDQHERFGEPAGVRTDHRNARRGFVPCRDVVVATASQHLYCADDFGSVFEHDVATGARTPRLFDRQTGVTGAARPHRRSERTPRVELQQRSGRTVEARRERSDPASDRLRRRFGRDVRVQHDGTALMSYRSFFDPSIWDPVTGEMTDPLDGVSSASSPTLPIASGPPSSCRTATQLVLEWRPVRHHDQHARVPGFRIDFEGHAPRPCERHRTSTHVPAVCETRSRCSTNSATTSARPSRPTATGDQPINSVQPSGDGTKVVISFDDGTYLFDAVTGRPTRCRPAAARSQRRQPERRRSRQHGRGRPVDLRSRHTRKARTSCRASTDTQNSWCSAQTVRCSPRRTKVTEPGSTTFRAEPNSARTSPTSTARSDTSACGLTARSSPSRTATSASCCGTSIRSTGWMRRARSQGATSPRTSGTSTSAPSASTTRAATATSPTVLSGDRITGGPHEDLADFGARSRIPGAVCSFAICSRARCNADALVTLSAPLTSVAARGSTVHTGRSSSATGSLSRARPVDSMINSARSASPPAP